MGLGVFSNVHLPKLKLPSDFDYDAKSDLISGLKNSLKGAKKQFDFSPVKEVAKKNAEGISFSKIGEKFKSTYESSGVGNVISNSFPDMNFTDLKQGVQAMKSLKEDDSITTKNPNEILNLSDTILGGTYEMKTSISSDEVQSDPAKYAGGTLPVVKKPTAGDSVFKLYPDANKEIEDQTNIFGPKKDIFTGYLFDSLVTSKSSGGSTEAAATSEVNDILDGVAATGDAGSEKAKEVKKGITNISYDQKKALNKMDQEKVIKELGIQDWESYFYSSENTETYNPEDMEKEIKGQHTPISNYDMAQNPSDYVTYHGRVIKKSYLNKGTWWVLDMLQHPFDHIADLMGEERLQKFGAFSDRLSNGVKQMRDMSLNNTGFNLDTIKGYDVNDGGAGKFLEEQKGMATSEYVSKDAEQIFKRNTGESVNMSNPTSILSLFTGNYEDIPSFTQDNSEFNNMMGSMTKMFNNGRDGEIAMGSMGLDFSGINYRDMQEMRSEPSYLKNVAYESKVEENIRNGFSLSHGEDHKSKWEVRVDTLNKGIDNPFNVDKEIKENDTIIDRIIKQII